MYLRLPEGWMVSSRPESGEFLVTCPACPPTLVTMAPPPPEDPTSDPTIPPPSSTST
jgi:hypothetical protein